VQPYRVSIPQFDGPLDLLLQLIERNKLDITHVSLAAVADQYLDYLRSSAQVDTDELAEFVVVGARLLLIKSRALLPRNDEADVDDEAAVDLTRRLRAYDAFRRAADALRAREETGERSYPRLLPPAPESAPPQIIGPGETTLPMLQVAYQQALTRRPPSAPHGTLVREVWTMRSAWRWLWDALGGGQRSFQTMVAGFRRPRLVATFLALLESSRLGLLRTEQAEAYAEIRVEPTASRDEAMERVETLGEEWASSRRSGAEPVRCAPPESGQGRKAVI